MFGMRVGGFVGLILLVPQMSVAVRRLHDVNCSGKELILPFAIMFAAGRSRHVSGASCRASSGSACSPLRSSSSPPCLATWSSPGPRCQTSGARARPLSPSPGRAPDALACRRTSLPSRQLAVASACRRGGLRLEAKPVPPWRNGRRDRLKIGCRETCPFKSDRGHQPSISPAPASASSPGCLRGDHGAGRRPQLRRPPAH